MDQDEQHIVEDQPLKVLNLFPKRDIQTLSLNYQNYSKLYQNLTCTICRELFKTPVYLKCSHRFCKDCIQKYIRSSSKKSCPNCRGQLSTRRDLRNDYSLESLITFAFTDVKSFTASMQQFDKIDIQRSKSLDMRKIDSQNQSRQRTRQQTPEEFGNLTPGFKRVKTSDADEPKKKRKMQSEKKIESKNIIQKQEKQISPPKKLGKPIEQKELGKQVQANQKHQIATKPQPSIPSISIQNFTTRQKGRKKKIQIIQIESNSEQIDLEVEEIRREQFLNPSEVLQNKNICSISMIPEVLPQVQSSKRIFSFQEVPIEAKDSMQEQKNLQEEKQNLVSPNKMSKKSSERKKEVNPQILRSIQILQAEFGTNYPLKIIELTPFPFYVELTLKKHPLSILTPEMISGSYKFSLRTSVNSISTFISDVLNISRQVVKLHTVENKQTISYVEVGQSLKLYEVNESYWKSWCGVELLELVELMSSDSGCNSQRQGRKVQRVIYYSIDFSELNI